MIISDSKEILGTSPRSLDFDGKEHLALLDEFKCLYTAITRAKCNLWVYDTNSNKRLPMFDYWVKRGLVEVKCEFNEGLVPVFKRSLSSSQEWEESGDELMKNDVYDQAEQCYMKAGALLKQLDAFICHSSLHAAIHDDSILQAYLLSFLLEPRVHYLDKIYECLQNLGNHQDAKGIDLLRKLQHAEDNVI